MRRVVGLVGDASGAKWCAALRVTTCRSGRRGLTAGAQLLIDIHMFCGQYCHPGKGSLCDGR